jgi:hypothetical protein
MTFLLSPVLLLSVQMVDALHGRLKAFMAVVMDSIDTYQFSDLFASS